jgi:hypothetical protein
VADAFSVMRERMGSLEPPTDEAIQAEYGTVSAQLQAEGVTEGDLSAARAFIRDLDAVSPGLIDSLHFSGAGNDAKLVRAAIKEARRRGYR